MLGTLADFAAAGRPEPVVLYRSLMTTGAEVMDRILNLRG